MAMLVRLGMYTDRIGSDRIGSGPHMHVDVTTKFAGKGEREGGREEGFDFVLAHLRKGI